MNHLKNHQRAIKLLELIHEANRMVIHHAGVYNMGLHNDFNNMMDHHKKRHGINEKIRERLVKAYNERVKLIQTL